MSGETEVARQHVSHWGDYAEDATGFGGVEWRTARDLLVRPRAVLDAYVAGGPTGFGRYARPTRFYLALCGVLMFYLFLVGGNQRLLCAIGPELMDPLIRWSGKDRAAFLGAADGWIGFAAVPLLALCYTVAVAPFLKRWGGYGWRLAFRAAFALMCAWTVPMLALGPLPYLERYAAPSALVIFGLLFPAFVRMGRGVWWTGWAGAIGKPVLLLVVLQVAAMIGMVALAVLAAVGVRMAG